MVIPLVHATGVAFAYDGEVPALRGVDFDLATEELVCILGPNGAGKSTLLKVLGGILAPDEGTVEVEGARLAGLTPRVRAQRIAFVPQALAALPDVTVGDFVAFGRYAHQGAFRRPTEADRSAVQRALAEADITNLAARPLVELSGGQRQRALVARALAQETQVLLVDEPTTALDPAHQVSVMELLDKLRAQGRAVAVVTHDLNLASQFATRLVVLDDGRKVADGSTDEVLREEVLEPIYGPSLRYEIWSSSTGPRPVVLPWRQA
ncbi:MAG: ABC transporter ATP-binding protein [Planctomycetota bacterium]|nr:ABC transporter ATP-binding protein [Planctomycetota bacterium]